MRARGERWRRARDSDRHGLARPRAHPRARGGHGPGGGLLPRPWGLTWGPFLDALARQFTVYAPGASGHDARGTPDAIQHVDSLWDLVLCYDELLEQLRLREVVLVGHSFGAMVACEVAAAPARRGCSGWSSSIRSASGATTRR